MRSHGAKGEIKRKGVKLFEDLVAEHDGLGSGLRLLKEMGNGAAHTATYCAADGSEQPVTGQILRHAIDEEFDHDDPDRTNVEAVLKCLESLAGQLQEDLFVQIA
ncbi:hypothetical protein GPECTOR_11g7 [Gonium pectorale]|uniref:Uncharacterized protein n=1 Tax=Gonium pectorale TaxID=33097 RepID=A0A150GQ56_GONPE|nr:hypothetical protein GPECTOR_11g7 [Gonium pectorale]|eukprot:KXZ51945.1 hypothetical protein GPECTOR_11g7 [Gonium pectorale]